PICGAPCRESASFRMYSQTPSMSCPPYSFGQVIPSQPLAASFFMNARRSGVSTSWAKFSRGGSITAGWWFSTSHFSTCSANACSCGSRSKSMRRILSHPIRFELPERAIHERERLGVTGRDAEGIFHHEQLRDARHQHGHDDGRARVEIDAGALRE